MKLLDVVWYALQRCGSSKVSLIWHSKPIFGTLCDSVLLAACAAILAAEICHTNLQVQRDVNDGGVAAYLLHAARQPVLQRLGVCAANNPDAHPLFAAGILPVVHHCVLELWAGTNRWKVLHLLAAAVPFPSGMYHP